MSSDTRPDLRLILLIVSYNEFFFFLSFNLSCLKKNSHFVLKKKLWDKLSKGKVKSLAIQK